LFLFLRDISLTLFMLIIRFRQMVVLFVEGKERSFGASRLSRLGEIGVADSIHLCSFTPKQINYLVFRKKCPSLF
jgi:hypothetical protein